MTFLEELDQFLENFRTTGVILNYQISDIDENHLTGAAIVYMVNIVSDKVEELYFYVWKSNDIINYKPMDRLPSRS
jgi:hypothetical protein